jgi:hypothetical protein
LGLKSDPSDETSQIIPPLVEKLVEESIKNAKEKGLALKEESIRMLRAVHLKSYYETHGVDFSEFVALIQGKKIGYIPWVAGCIGIGSIIGIFAAVFGAFFSGNISGLLLIAVMLGLALLGFSLMVTWFLWPLRTHL